MPLYIKDETTAQLVKELARQRGSTKQDAVKFAVQAELTRNVEQMPLREKFATLRRMYPLPPPTGEAADKEFFDELSGDL